VAYISKKVAPSAFSGADGQRLPGSVGSSARALRTSTPIICLCRSARASDAAGGRFVQYSGAGAGQTART